MNQSVVCQRLVCLAPQKIHNAYRAKNRAYVAKTIHHYQKITIRGDKQNMHIQQCLQQMHMQRSLVGREGEDECESFKPLTVRVKAHGLQNHRS